MSAKPSNYAPSARIVRRAPRRSVVVGLGDEVVWGRDDTAVSRRVGWSQGIAAHFVDGMVERALSVASSSWVTGFPRGGEN